jgi:hypothetical protein
MKKNFFKKLSFVTAFALVATAVAPAGLASAATTPNLAKRYTTVYEGASRAYAVKDATGYTVKWTVSGEGAEYASLSKTSGAKTALSVDTEGEMAAKNANVTVRANFYKDGKLVKSAGDVVTVKVNATALDITSDADLTAVPAGTSVDLNRAITPANATSVTYWSVTDKDGKATTDATIDGAGNFTATKLGEYIVVAEAKNVKDGVVKAADTQAVTVVLNIVSAVQASTTDLDVTFNADMTGALASDFSIVKDDTKQVIAVKSVEVEGKTVTVSTFAEIKDGKTYTVSYKGTSLQFVATDNKVASLAISPATVAYADPTTVKVALIDADGVILKEHNYSEEDDAKLDFKIETTEGYTSGKELVLFEKGNTAKATATYHTYEYDANGNEVGAITTTLTITAVDPAAVTVKEAKYTIDDTAYTGDDWSDVTINTKLAIEDEDNNTLSVYVEKTDDDVNVAEDYDLESSDTDVLIVIDNGNGTAELVAVAKGTAYVLVKDSDGNIVYSFPVSIVAEREPATLVLGTTSVTLSNATAVAAKKDVTVEQNDQYGDEMDEILAGDIEVEALSETADGVILADVDPGVYYLVDDGKVTFYGTASNGTTTPIAAGTYQYKITVGDLSKVVRVVVQEPSTADGVYKLEVSANKVDMNFDGSSTDDKAVVIKVAVVKGGVVSSYETFAASDVTIKRDGTTVTGSAIAVTSIGTVTGSKVTFTALDVEPGTVTKVKTGNYTVSVVVDGVTLNGGFVIEDTQSIVTAERVDDVVTAGPLDTVIKAAFDFYYDGKDLDDADFTVTAVDALPDDTLVDGVYYIKTITVNVDVEGYDVPMTITVNKSITVN